jgi:uncharacterized protein (TIGR02271 family)
MNLNAQNAGEYIVAGIFEDYSHAENAIRDLKDAGIPANRIGIGIGQEVADSKLSDGAQHEGFWRKIGDFFEGKDHSADSADYDANLGEVDASGPERVVVSVSALTPEERQVAEDILEEHNAQIEAGDVSQNASMSGQPDADGRFQGGERLQLLSEVLRVHKERVSKGEVRLRKEVVSENQTIEVPVTREELVIDRVPAEASAAPAGEIGSNREVRVPLTEEQVRVEKRPIVKEEVRVGKKRVQESKQVKEQVMREELQVSGEGDIKIDRKTGVA